MLSFICNSLHARFFVFACSQYLLHGFFKEMPCLIHPKTNSVSIHRVYQLDLPNLPRQKYPFHCLALLVLYHNDFQSATDFNYSCNIIMRDHFLDLNEKTVYIEHTISGSAKYASHCLAFFCRPWD